VQERTHDGFAKSLLYLQEAISDDSTQDTNSPAPPAILSPDDSLLEPPTTTENSMDAGTAEDDSSRECSNQAQDLPPSLAPVVACVVDESAQPPMEEAFNKKVMSPLKLTHESLIF
jgi:hypothetical protein